MKTIDEIIDGYFEGTLSVHEETLLKAFLVSPEGQGPEYDEVRAVMGYFATGRSVILSEAKDLVSRGAKTLPTGIYPDMARSAARRRSLRPRIGTIAAVAASLAILITLGINILNQKNICVSFVGGQKITDKEVVMNDVDNILADLLTDRTDMEELLNDFFDK